MSSNAPDPDIPTIECGADIIAWLNIIRQTKNDIARLEERLSVARTAVEEHLGEHELGIDEQGRPLVHWTKVTRSAIDTKKVRGLLDETQLASVMTTSVVRRFTLEEPS